MSRRPRAGWFFVALGGVGAVGALATIMFVEGDERVGRLGVPVWLYGPILVVTFVAILIYGAILVVRRRP
ncbi:hypothetical protein PUW79_13650 [Microbacterium sp. NE2HP2]|uniref:hypothetical protein n=1 Tax=Microbacterium TaxID=33882 RepID=UPI002366BE8A|nr:hypothetical protein [Microbacterium plantarum]MDD7945683.1 hypothetical protein [Microbacterium plantarum]